MLAVIVINLYCSRLILNQLGFTDYGIYNIVAGTVILLSFLQNALSGASARFIIFEIGKGTKGDINTVFNATLYVHITIIIFVVVAAGIFGNFFLGSLLDIPSDRLSTAKKVFLFSVITVLVNTLYIPFEALLFAYEKFRIYAISSIAEAVGKLLGAFLIMLSVFNDKLLWYGIFIFAAVFTNKIAIILYTHAKLTTGIKIGTLANKSSFRPIIAFFGWDIYGNLSLVLKDQGINILLNVFFGPLLNAANGIAQQVNMAVGAFSNSFLMAVKPQIIKKYASEDLDDMTRLIYKASKFSFFILLLISLPLLFEIKFILTLWLENVPEYTIEFCQYLILINLIIGTMQSVNYSIHATGNIKMLSFLSGTIFMLILPVVYLGFKNNMSPMFSYATVLIFTLIAATINLTILQRYISQFSIRGFISRVVIRCVLVSGISVGAVIILQYFISFDVTWMRFAKAIIVVPLIILGCIYIFGTDTEERLIIKRFFKKN